MILQYEVTIDDILAFHRHHIANSRTIRNQKLFVIVFAGVTVFGLALLLDIGPSLGTRLLLAAIFTLTFGLLFYFRHGASTERQAKKLLAEGGSAGLLGMHELVIENAWLTERTDVNETRHAWSAVDRVAQTQDHVFIYLSALQAHVIPKRRIVQGDFAAFMQRLAQLVPARQAEV